MADTHRIHLVRSPQDQASKPQTLDAKDIASQALAIAKECTEQLSNFQDYHEMMVQQLAANLAQLEIVALRSMARRRS
jgi:hypothetical protein